MTSRRVPGRSREIDLAEPVEERGRWGRLRDEPRRVEADHQGVLVGWLAGEPDLAVRRQPAAGWHRCRRSLGPSLLERAEPEAQQRRRDQRRPEDDRHHGGVEVAVEHALGEPDAREDQADLPAGEHAEADEEPVADSAEHPRAGGDLPHARHDDERADQEEEVRVTERVQVGVHSDLEEEHRDEQVPDRREVAAHALGGRGAAQRHAGRERAHDRCELCDVGQQREHQRERERDRDERAGRPRVAVDEAEEARAEARPDGHGKHEEADRHDDDLRDVEQRHRPGGRHAHDDREQDQTHHVVGDGCAQHRPRLDARRARRGR